MSPPREHFYVRCRCVHSASSTNVSFRAERVICSAAACEAVLSPRRDVSTVVLQRRKVLRWQAMPCRLFVGVGILDQRGLRESSSQKRQPGWERTIGESHGHGNRRKAGLRRENLAI